MAKVYDMKREGWNEYYELRVSKNQKEMVKDMIKIYKLNKWPLENDFDCTQGLVYPIYNSEKFAICFLHEDRLGPGVVSHEMLHVAFAHERNILRFKMDYGPKIGVDEERVAYFMTSLMAGVYETLYENKHIKSKL